METKPESSVNYIEVKDTSVTITDEKVDISKLTASEMYPDVDEKKLLRKMDLHIVPTLAVLYLLSFLDRGNIGNANIEGLSTDLNLVGNQYNLCLTIFFISYCVFEVPSNAILKVLRPSIWLPTIMICWGLVMTLMGLVQGFTGLFVARFFLGMTEAGLFPGVAYYLTQWYRRGEMQFRQAMFFSAASIAGAFSGLLAFGIAKMDGVGNLEGWRWIFILEGIVTVIVAAASFFLLYDYPETAKFLTERERLFVIHRLKYDHNSANPSETDGESGRTHIFVPENHEHGWKYFWAAFKDWQIYLHLILYYGIVVPLYGISLFLPTILKNLGYVSSKAQLMTIPIYITASIFSVIQAFISDRVGLRSPFILFNLIFLLVGYSMAISTNPADKPGVIYAGVYIAALGVYPAFPGIISWLSNNLSGSYKRAIGMAIHIGVGNFGGAFASNIYHAKDKPRFIMGHAIELGFISLGIISLLILVASYRFVNNRRAKGIREGKYDNLTIEELSQMGDKNPYFRYRY
jgi:MFS family permease